MKYVTLEIEGKQHVLEFNRWAIKKIESLGFSLKDADNKLVTTIELLFYGSLLKNNNFINQKTAADLLTEVLKEYKSDNLLDILIDLFMCAVPVIGDSDSEGESEKKTLQIQVR
jgi:hypothetical protein